MLVFKILKLFGLDVPARIAEARIDLEDRLDLAKDSLQQGAQTAAVLATMFLLAGLAALAAFAVGLVALHTWVSSHHGPLYGLAAVGGVLLLVAAVLAASGMSKLKAWSGESARRLTAKKMEIAQTHVERVAAAKEEIARLAMQPLSPPAVSAELGTAADLVEPLTWALSTTLEIPKIGNPALDELVARLRNSAGGAAGEVVEAAIRTVRYGDSPQLLATLGSAFVVGWFLGHHCQLKGGAHSR